MPEFSKVPQSDQNMYMNRSEGFPIFTTKIGQKLMAGNHQNVHELLQMVSHFLKQKNGQKTVVENH